jgi:GDP-mannose 6-dehydrogenase
LARFSRAIIERIVQEISNTGRQSIGLLGLSFKQGSDDMRDSPLVTLAELLLEKGFVVRIFDADIRLDNLIGANRRFIADRLPDISRHMVPSITELIQHSELLVLGKMPRECLQPLRDDLRDDQFIVDLIGVGDPCICRRDNYRGICW